MKKLPKSELIKFGKELKAGIKSFGLTQKEFSAASGIQESALSDIICGKRDMNFKKIKGIMKAYLEAEKKEPTPVEVSFFDPIPCEKTQNGDETQEAELPAVKSSKPYDDKSKPVKLTNKNEWNCFISDAIDYSSVLVTEHKAIIVSIYECEDGTYDMRFLGFSGKEENIHNFWKEGAQSYKGIGMFEHKKAGENGESGKTYYTSSAFDVSKLDGRFVVARLEKNTNYKGERTPFFTLKLRTFVTGRNASTASCKAEPVEATSEPSIKVTACEEPVFALTESFLKDKLLFDKRMFDLYALKTGTAVVKHTVMENQADIWAEFQARLSNEFPPLRMLFQYGKFVGEIDDTYHFVVMEKAKSLAYMKLKEPKVEKQLGDMLTEISGRRSYFCTELESKERDNTNA